MFFPETAAHLAVRDRNDEKVAMKSDGRASASRDDP
jgi:hypothetical protein